MSISASIDKELFFSCTFHEPLLLLGKLLLDLMCICELLLSFVFPD